MGPEEPGSHAVGAPGMVGRRAASSRDTAGGSLGTAVRGGPVSWEGACSCILTVLAHGWDQLWGA